jgi:hypothetical protein
MATATKIDLKKELHQIYAPPRHPVLVDVPRLRYLMVDGALSPGSRGPGDDPAFREAVQALYSVSYTMKFASKGSGGDYVVMPLEGLFWTCGAEEVRPDETARMEWTLMIAQPPQITQARVDGAIAQLLDRGRVAAPPEVRLETLEEGLAAQILYLGPYAEEQPTIERLHAFIEESGLVKRGKHHEIYLSDPNRTAPERLKTVIRQPVATSP